MSARHTWPTWPPPPGTGPHRRRRRARWILLWALAALLGVLALGAGGVWWGTNHYAGHVQRIPHALPDLPSDQRPEKVKGTAGAENFLLVGVDSRSVRPTTGSDSKAPLWKPGAQRSDTILLVHLSADRKSLYAVSIPRDTWVTIPGHGKAKINAAFSWGGPPLLVDTVEKLTDVRIDHFAVIDWHGFKSLTDKVGGVTITVPTSSYDSEQHRHFKAGTYTMNGTEALAYVRQRHGLPGGDRGRIEHQQQFLHSLLGKVGDEISLTDPLRTHRVLNAVTDAVSVDDTMSNGELRDLALGLRHLSSDRTTFVTAPIASSGWEGKQSVLYLDQTKAKAMWQAIRADRVP
ncbi:LCP family protein [Streptomyces sp. NPDC050145]|uniref:LCP family protein n=1 Tax=Streptomyces sp. NPDC050145 TaxID=3365602 RepID=UPI0037B2C6EE